MSKNPSRGGRCYKCVNGSRVFAIAGMSGELKHFDVNPGFVILRIFIFMLPTITMILDFTGNARFYTGDFTLLVKYRYLRKVLHNKLFSCLFLCVISCNLCEHYQCSNGVSLILHHIIPRPIIIVLLLCCY